MTRILAALAIFTAGCSSGGFNIDVEQTHLARAPGAVAFSRKGTISISGDDARLVVEPVTAQGEFPEPVDVDKNWKILEYRNADGVSYVVAYDPAVWSVSSPPPGPVCELVRRP